MCICLKNKTINLLFYDSLRIAIFYLLVESKNNIIRETFIKKITAWDWNLLWTNLLRIYCRSLYYSLLTTTSPLWQRLTTIASIKRHIAIIPLCLGRQQLVDRNSWITIDHHPAAISLSRAEGSATSGGGWRGDDDVDVLFASPIHCEKCNPISRFPTCRCAIGSAENSHRHFSRSTAIRRTRVKKKKIENLERTFLRDEI